MHITPSGIPKDLWPYLTQLKLNSTQFLWTLYKFIDFVLKSQDQVSDFKSEILNVLRWQKHQRNDGR